MKCIQKKNDPRDPLESIWKQDGKLNHIYKIKRHAEVPKTWNNRDNSQLCPTKKKIDQKSNFKRTLYLSPSTTVAMIAKPAHIQKTISDFTFIMINVKPSPPKPPPQPQSTIAIWLCQAKTQKKGVQSSLATHKTQNTYTTDWDYSFTDSEEYLSVSNSSQITFQQLKLNVIRQQISISKKVSKWRLAGSNIRI